MTGLSLTVIVVSRHRAGPLARCLTGLRQQIGAEPEVVVVADPVSVAAVRSDDLRCITFDEPNISAARNLGLASASGAVVAFIDDDAVAEPTWAARLLAAFESPDVVAATGYVRGRNGISYQWKASAVDREGQEIGLNLSDKGIHLPDPGEGRAIKTQGTNCAFRADALRQIGGFDPAYRFFFDETDVNLRLCDLGRTAVVPLAQVHHGYLASDRRRGDRVPLSLFEIAASTAVFLRRHAPGMIETGLVRLRAEQEARLEAHRAAGRIDRNEMLRLMQSLFDGWQEGLSRPLSDLPPLSRPDPGFLPLRRNANGSGEVLTGWVWRRGALLRAARAALREGRIVTVLCLSPGVRRHRVVFLDEGIWLQTGGVWGRADRSRPPPVGLGFRARCRMELSEFCRFRPVG